MSGHSRAYQVASVPCAVLNFACLSEGLLSVAPIGSNNDFVEGAGHQGAGEFALFSRRINSFNASYSGIMFGSLALFSLLVAATFAAFGAWLILPFAGLEAVALYLAFDWVVRHADDMEQLVIRGDAVALEVREQSQTQRYEFNRVWAKLVEDRNKGELRLVLRSHGREVEVGRYLNGSGRRTLARELKARLQAR